jgi:UDP-N-acetylmuramoyl-L-alanyl-D-glutamate--2,6-diaminopimelate ligase
VTPPADRPDPALTGVARPVADVVAGRRSNLPLRLAGDGATLVTGVVQDSRAVVAGSLFCCVPGASTDGHDHAGAAVAAGATALLVERELDLPVVQLVVPDAREAMGPLAASFHGHPSDHLTVVGITGTNGKTTTSMLLAAVLRHAGRSVAVIGTLGGTRTTPEATDLQAALAAARDRGDDTVVMEVSSHTLALHRVDGTRFALAVFTNLGRDHLDLHGTEERYFAAKALLFAPALSERGVVNGDDVHGTLLVDAAEIPVTAYHRDEASDVEVTATRHRYRWRGVVVDVAIGGPFNVMNSLAAATAASVLGLEPAAIAAGLAAAPPVPGRFEPVDAGQPFAVIVDYAHTPDGLREALAAARRVAAGHRVVVVFGCGGDRDRDKRPEMGRVAAELADRAVVTSDNPRSEDPAAIADAVMSGVPDEYRGRVVVELDRRLGIAAGFRAAGPGDVVVLAGKGHETTQTIGSTVVPFDDRAVARELLETKS